MLPVSEILPRFPKRIRVNDSSESGCEVWVRFSVPHPSLPTVPRRPPGRGWDFSFSSSATASPSKNRPPHPGKTPLLIETLRCAGRIQRHHGPSFLTTMTWLASSCRAPAIYILPFKVDIASVFFLYIGKCLNSHLTEEGRQMTNKHMKNKHNVICH